MTCQLPNCDKPYTHIVTFKSGGQMVARRACGNPHAHQIAKNKTHIVTPCALLHTDH